MKTLRLIGCVAVCLAASAVFAANAEPDKDKPAPGCDKKEYESGLIAHYYRDPEFWDGNWPDGKKPVVAPKDWTFSTYKYSRKEPLINHQFIRCGWFSVRWNGYLDTAPAGETGIPAVYKLEIWADDGCRLFVDGQPVIDSWRDCPEDIPESHRVAELFLKPGKHKIAVEYFQGQSLKRDDKDPMKFYWECEERGIPHQIVPASHFCHNANDLTPSPGRLDEPAKDDPGADKPEPKKDNKTNVDPQPGKGKWWADLVGKWDKLSQREKGQYLSRMNRDDLRDFREALGKR